MTPDKLDTSDPLSDASVAVQHLRALIDAMHAVTREDAERYGTDPMLTLTRFATDQCIHLDAYLEQMMKEIDEGRMPGRPGTPGQYGPQRDKDGFPLPTPPSTGKERHSC